MAKERQEMTREIFCSQCQWNFSQDDEIVDCACCDLKYHKIECYDKHKIELEKRNKEMRNL